MGKPSGDEQSRAKRDRRPKGARRESEANQTSYEADGMERAGTTQRNSFILSPIRIRVSQILASHALEVNEALGWWRFSSLPGEPERSGDSRRQISITCGRESGSAAGSNVCGDGREPSEARQPDNSQFSPKSGNTAEAIVLRQ